MTRLLETATRLRCLGLLLLVAVPAAARTIGVPDQAPTIGAALAQAQGGDIVLVSCGTYQEHDLRVPSGVSLWSGTLQPDCTIIDAGGAGRVFVFDGGDSTTAVVGFTLRGGASDGDGGAVLCRDAAPKLSRCIIEASRARRGGGLAVTGDRGPRLEDCTLRRNEATLHGGGVWWDGPAAGRIARTVLVSNRALAGGGLAAASATGLRLVSVTVTDNLAGGTGGGLWLDGGAPAVLRSLLVRNHGSLGGGGLHARGGRINLDGCTVADNGSEGTGGLLLEGGQPRVIRSIVAFNDGEAIQLVGATPAIDGTNIYGHPGGDWIGPLADLAGRGGNFSLDPLFCSLESGRFDLSARSPCLAENRPGGQRVGASGRGCP